ncbi:Hypothetical protein SMAX5B_007577 [Scophthalmus maximus]|uniref:Uncharacterized protein n=1 Tax=Scophthalmus maximus TaxID=52904 RepID=A0A2U9BP36_SCOMX|nr:Hypothetical protein SMAX5B_007577 [Scophthalmus maximus]
MFLDSHNGKWKERKQHKNNLKLLNCMHESQSVQSKGCGANNVLQPWKGKQGADVPSL